MNKDFSLLTENFGRVRQGLRVLEDMVQFIFGDQELSQALKSLRNSLSQTEAWFGSAHLIASRVRPTVVSQNFTQKEFHHQSSLYGMIHSNSSQVCDALQILEEFSGIYSPQNAFLFQKARYQVFSVERDLVVRTPHFYLLQYFEQGVVYPISDSVDDLKDFVDAGAKMIQLNDTKSSKDLVLKKTKEICRFLQKRYTEEKEKVIFLVHEYVDIVSQTPVDGLHVHKNKNPISQARYILGSNKIISQTVQSLDQSRKSLFSGVDGVSFSELFGEFGKNEKMFEELKKCIQQIHLPVSGVGNIDPETIQQVFDTGCKNVGVTESAKDFFVKRG